MIIITFTLFAYINLTILDYQTEYFKKLAVKQILKYERKPNNLKSERF